MRRIVATIVTVGVLLGLLAVPAVASPGDIDTWLRIPEPTDVVVDELGNTYILDAATASISVRECDGTIREIAHEVASDAITVSKDGKLYFMRAAATADALELIEWVAGVEAVLQTFPIPAGNAAPHVTGMAVDDRGTVYFGHHTHFDSEDDDYDLEVSVPGFEESGSEGRYVEDLTAFDVTTGLVSTAYPWNPSTSPPPPYGDACHAFTSGIKIYGYVPLIANETACGRTWEGHQGSRGMAVSGDSLYIVQGGDASIEVIELSTGAYRRLEPSYRYVREGFSEAPPVTLSDVTVDRDGTLLVVDEANHTVWRITEDDPKDGWYGYSHGLRIAGLHPDPIEPHYLPGSYTGDGYPAVLATFNQPTGIAVDGNGNILIADRKNGAIRVIEGSGPLDCPAGIPSVTVAVDQTEIRGNGSIDIRGTITDVDGASDIEFAVLTVTDSHGREIARFEDFSQVDPRTVERVVDDQKLSGPGPWKVLVEARDTAGHSIQASETVSR